MKKGISLNSFALKIIAMVTMAIDHLGVSISSLWGITTSFEPFYYTCRYIGRIAMPLYCFMLVEGVIHTRNYKKYALRLGIMALLISAFLAICEYVPQLGFSSIASMGNIFLDLLLGSVMIYCLRHKNKYIKLLAIIPFGISIFSFVAKGIEWSGSCVDCGYTTTYLWYPQFLRLQYDWLSLGLMLGYFLSYLATKIYFKIRFEEYGTLENMEGTKEYRLTVNLFAVIFTVIVSLLYYCVRYMNSSWVFWDAGMQLFAVIASVFIVLYNSQRGYNAKWFNIFSYIYYPLHIILIYGICYLIYLI